MKWPIQLQIGAVPTILSCILVLPHQQRRGYGKFLIDVAYELARRENRRGSAERPLSIAGRQSFYAYWAGRAAQALAELGTSFTLEEFSQLTGIMEEDLLECLKDLGLLRTWGTSTVLLSSPAAVELLRRKAGSPSNLFARHKLLWFKRQSSGYTEASTANATAAPSPVEALSVASYAPSEHEANILS